MSDIIESLTDFQRKGNYENLSVSQKIEMGVLSFSEALKINDAEQLSEAAEWYYSNSSISKTDKKEEYLKWIRRGWIFFSGC